MHLRNLILFLAFGVWGSQIMAQNPATEADIIGNWEIETVSYSENGEEQDNSGLMNLLEGNVYHYRKDSVFSVSSFLAKEGQYPGKWYVLDGHIFEQSYFGEEWVESEVEKVDDDRIRFVSRDETSVTAILMTRKAD